MATLDPSPGPGAPTAGTDRPPVRLAGKPRGRGAELGLRSASCAAALVPVVALAFILLTLVLEAWPALVYNGWGFFTRVPWVPGSLYGNVVRTGGIVHPSGVSYGGLPLIVGTLESSAIALFLAMPISVAAALAVVDKLPPRLSRGVGFFLETLAGIPSVVFGLWGSITLGPLLARDVYPVIADHAPDVPVLSFFRGDPGHGEGLLTSAIVLAIMVVPIVASTTRDLLRQVPVLPREGAHALGMTDWQVARRVSLPWVSAGIIGASVLGLCTRPSPPSPPRLSPSSTRPCPTRRALPCGPWPRPAWS